MSVSPRVGSRIASLGAVTEERVDQGGPSGHSTFVYIDIGSIDNESKRIVDPKTLAVEAAPSRARQRLQSNDVLVSMTRPNLNAVAVVPPELDGAIGSTGFHVLRGATADPSWLFYAVQTPSFVDAMCGVVQGALYPAVRPKDIRAYQIPLPSRNEQRAIVAEIEKQFTRLDAGVAALRRLQANLKRYRAAVLKAACEGRLVPTEAELARKEGRTYETGEQLLQRILVERRKNWKSRGRYVEPSAPPSALLLSLPEGWTWTTIESLSDVVLGGSPRPAGDPRYFGGDVPWITVGPLTADEGPYLDSVSTTLTSAGRERSRYIHAETLLLTNSGATLGVPKITKIAGCINDGVAALLGIDYPLKLYLLYFLRTRTKHLRGLNQGAAQPNLNTTVIKAIAVPLPPRDEQVRIVSELERRLSIVNELESVVTISLRRAIALRQSVLQRAFSGELVKTEARPTAVAAFSAPPVSRQRRHFARAVLSGEIVHRLHGEQTFGRVKHQKIFHLCEHVAGLPEIQGEYHREAAGPLDNKLIYANAAELKKQKWYAQVDRVGTGHEYKALAKAGGHRKYAERLWKDQLPAVERLIEMMRTWTTERCEIFSTVYAAWNDLILWGREVTDDAIVHEILHRWHESKKRIPEKTWRAAIGWMRREGFVPTGFGRPTAAPGPDDAQASGR